MLEWFAVTEYFKGAVVMSVKEKQLLRSYLSVLSLRIVVSNELYAIAG